ncbi:MAG: sulfatase-like hydrolase/transferase [Opitutae bacterium]|jgi:arylsulfatase A-like enzyme|nr:sulfatase-like hydrolase/transferase [Opitutae bacterium]
MGGHTPSCEEEPIASMLKESGYATGGFGEWRCGGRGSTGVPETHGFDVFLSYYDQVHAHSYYEPYIIRNSKAVQLKRLYVRLRVFSEINDGPWASIAGFGVLGN